MNSSIWLVLCSVITVNAWLTPTVQTHARRSILVTDHHHRQQQHSFVSLRAKTVDDDNATTIVQRTFYRFSHGSDVDVHNSMVMEDRWSIDASEIDASTQSSKNSAGGHRTILLRDGNVEEGEIGDVFYSISPEQGVLSTSEMAMALYLASNPTLCTEDMMEVSSETGLASILGCIGAGFVLRRENSDDNNRFEEEEEDDNILTISKPKNKFLPPTLEKLTLTASDERHLDALMRNSQHSGITSSGKLMVEPLDWRVKSGTTRGGAHPVPPEVATIVAVDLALTYPEAVSLARTCAYRLRPSWVGRDVSHSAIPRLVHLCPADRDDVAYLQRELTTGYKMTAFTGYLKLEKIIFCPQTVPHATADNVLEDMELEVQEERFLTFSSLVAQHHPDYAGGGSGELFFPADTGATGFREAESSW